MKNFVIIIAILAFIAVGVITLRLFTDTGNTIKSDITESINEGNEGNIKEFRIRAFRFGYSPDTIIINKGDRVRIIIENTDVTHGITIPELNVAGENIVEFIADREGEFTWYCFIYCGPGHPEMSGKLIVK